MVTSKYYWEHRERCITDHKKWLVKNPGAVAKSCTAWRRRNKAKYLAQVYARRYAPLKDKCEQCGSIENLQRHHFDYSKPLDVITLCKKCHEARPDAIESEDRPSCRHCDNCGLVYPDCGRGHPSFTGRNCSLWRDLSVTGEKVNP